MLELKTPCSCACALLWLCCLMSTHSTDELLCSKPNTQMLLGDAKAVCAQLKAKVSEHYGS